MRNRIRELRQKMGLTLDEMAEGTGVKRGSINNYENGKNWPKQETWQTLANYFDVSIDYLMGGKGMISIDEPDVVYCCFVIGGGKYLAKQDTKLYKRKGDAAKRVKKLNLTTEFDWIVLAASGWHAVEK